MTATGDPACYELAYQAGLDAVDEQATTLRETRDRAGSLVSAAVVAGGLAAGLAFNTDRVTSIDPPGVVGTILAVAGFVGVLISTLSIWRPTEGRFSHDPGVIVGSYVERRDGPVELPELHRELALWLGDQVESNRKMVEVQLRTFTFGLVALLAETLGLVFTLGDVASG